MEKKLLEESNEHFENPPSDAEVAQHIQDIINKTLAMKPHTLVVLALGPADPAHLSPGENPDDHTAMSVASMGKRHLLHQLLVQGLVELIKQVTRDMQQEIPPAVQARLNELVNGVSGSGDLGANPGKEAVMRHLLKGMKWPEDPGSIN